MKKTCVFLAGILVIFIAFACEMPSSIEFKSDRFEMNAPVKLGRFSLVSILSEALKGSFPEGSEFYDMVNYPNAQAFLIGYQMDLMKSFNPDDYLENLKKPGGIDPIYPEPIVIPKMTTDIMSDTWFYFAMQAFFDDMQEKINGHSTPEKEADLYVLHTDNNPQSIPLVSPLDGLPPFMVFRNDDPDEDNFDAVFMQEGRVELNIKLKFTNPIDPSDPDLEHLVIKVTGIELKGSDTQHYIGDSEDGPKTATLSYPDFTDKIIINFKEGEEIRYDDPPQFIILDDITSTYSGALSLPKAFAFTLYIQPQLEDIALRGARALKIGEMTKPVPPGIVNNIRMAPVDDMINAKIASGEFRITAKPPHPDDVGTQTTYCEGLDIGCLVVLQQDPADPIGSVTFPTTECLGGAEFPDAVTENSLEGKWISGKEMTINEPASTIIIKADPTTGTTFELFPDEGHIYNGNLPYEHKVLPIKLDMGLNIEELEVVRWKGSFLPDIDIPEINFANMGDEKVSFIESITFSEIKLNVDFTVPDPPPSPPPPPPPRPPPRSQPAHTGIGAAN